MNKGIYILLIIGAFYILYNTIGKEAIESKRVILKYEVGHCIVPTNGTGPFLITKLTKTVIDGDTYRNVCIINNSQPPKNFNANVFDFRNNLSTGESCMPVDFWDSFIEDFKWSVLKECPNGKR